MERRENSRRRKTGHAVKVLAFTTLIQAILSGNVFADLQGRVVRVLDGDTIKVLQASRERSRIRLDGIDAPEKKQAFGHRSRQFLNDQVALQRVTGRMTDLVAMNIDLAFQAGTLTDSALISRTIIKFGYPLVASPEYRSQKRALVRQQDLSAFSCIKFISSASRPDWKLLTGREIRKEVFTQLCNQAG